MRTLSIVLVTVVSLAAGAFLGVMADLVVGFWMNTKALKCYSVMSHQGEMLIGEQMCVIEHGL
jgi:hypothetical protein